MPKDVRLALLVSFHFIFDTMFKYPTIILFDSVANNRDFAGLLKRELGGKIMIYTGLMSTNEFVLNILDKHHFEEWDFVMVNHKINIPIYKVLKFIPTSFLNKFTIVSNHIKIREYVKDLGCNKVVRDFSQLLSASTLSVSPIREKNGASDIAVGELSALPERIVVQTINELVLVRLSKVNYMIAEGSYTFIHEMENKTLLRVSRNLNYFSNLLAGYNYLVKLSRSLIVNTNNICRVERIENSKGKIHFYDSSAYEISNSDRLRLMRVLKLSEDVITTSISEELVSEID